jgi:hypothetical protein
MMIDGDYMHLHHPECGHGSWCYSHWMMEPTDATTFRVCFECKHVYPTEESLVKAHNDFLHVLNREVNPKGHPDFELTEPLPDVTTASQIYSCPECIHDF